MHGALGRYQSTVMGSYQTIELIETFVSYAESIKRCICIIYDPQRSGTGTSRAEGHQAQGGLHQGAPPSPPLSPSHAPLCQRATCSWHRMSCSPGPPCCWLPRHLPMCASCALEPLLPSAQRAGLPPQELPACAAPTTLQYA